MNGLDIILPGEVFQSSTSLKIKKNIIKQLDSSSNQYISLNTGYVESKENESGESINRFISINETYFARPEDRVIGIIINKKMDSYELDIKSCKKALLNNLAFEGATKKSKPNLLNGDLIFCRVEKETTYMTTILTCTSNTNKKEWSSGESLFGQLKNGLEINIPLFFAYYLSRNTLFFDQIKQRITIEVVIGINGILWIKTKNNKNMLLLESFFNQAPHININSALELLKQKMEIFEM